MEPTEITHESRSSIEFSRDAKGTPRWTVKIYEGSSLEALREIVDQIEMIDYKIRNEPELFGTPFTSKETT